MTQSPSTTSQDDLVAAALATLAGQGYVWSRGTTSLNQYLATALSGIGGANVSHLTMSMPQLLAGLVNALGAGPVTHLNTTVVQLFAAIGGASNGIRLSASSLAENSANGSAVGSLSVSGGTGTYTFTLTDTAGSRFKVAGTNGVNLQAGATNSDYETATAYNITVHADNGAGSTFDRTFAIAILDVAEGGGSDDDDYAAWTAAA